jgi:predicted nucleic acid-binding protein
MAINPSKFHLLNVADTCAVWNVLSSTLLFHTADSANCVFSCTAYVAYECLVKPRKSSNSKDEELIKQLKNEQTKNKFQVYHLEIEDLLEVEILAKRKNLGKGELSSIAFAKRTNQAFLTDDQGARKLASQVMEISRVQTTPHLLGWLFYIRRISDIDKDSIVSQHEYFNRPLKKYFEEIYSQVLHYNLLESGKYNS